MSKPAISIDPPAVPDGRDRCLCCEGPIGAKSWKMPVCLTCYDAQQGRRTDHTVYRIMGRGTRWRIVRYARKHTRCPLNGGRPYLVSDRAKSGLPLESILAGGLVT